MRIENALKATIIKYALTLRLLGMALPGSDRTLNIHHPMFVFEFGDRAYVIKIDGRVITLQDETISIGGSLLTA